MDPKQIHSIFQQYLGRNASDAELSGFGDAISKGIMDPVGLGLFLQGSSEAQQRNAQGSAQSLAGGLASLPGYDDKVAVKTAQDGAVGRMAELGRPDSSGLSAQFAQIGAQSAEAHRNATYGAAAGYLTNAYNNSQNGNAQNNSLYNGNMGAVRQQGYNVEKQNFDAAQTDKYYNFAQQMGQQNQFGDLMGAGIGAGGKILGAGIAKGWF